MLTIRLQRTGRRNLASYRIVLAEKSAAAKGKCKEILGHFLPQRNPNVLEFKEDRVKHWLSHGAEMSNTAARILTKAGVQGLERFILKYTKQRKKSEMKEEGAASPPPVQQAQGEQTSKNSGAEAATVKPAPASPPAEEAKS